MKKLIFILSLIILSVTSFGQDVVGGRVIARQSLFVNGIWVDSIRVDTLNISGDNRTLMTSGAIYKFVSNRIGGGGGGSGTVTSVTGTANRITITGTPTVAPVINIAATYVGQSSITTLGTISTGVWNGTAIANANLANSSLTIGSTTISLGATSTTLAGLTSVTSTTFIGAVTGNASTATALATGRTISITGDLAYTSPTFDGTTNITAAGTLATVNSNVGTFGSATAVGTFTVNGKGLITAASNVTITPAVGSITGLGTGVATALAVNIGTAGSFVVNGGALGTPSSGTLTNATGLPEGGLSMTDITTNNTSTTQHGFFPKLTANRLYYVNNSGALTALAFGTTGKVLTTNGATSDPTWETPSGGGSTWNGITDPTGTQTLSFDDAELTAWTNGSNTETFLTVTNNSLTTGKGELWQSSSITTGNLASFVSTSTVGNGFSLININSSGANGTATKTATGQTISVTNTGTTSTNVGLTSTASGATNNYAAVFPSGFVGIGTSTPAVFLELKTAAGGSTDFQITDAGSSQYRLKIKDNAATIEGFNSVMQLFNAYSAGALNLGGYNVGDQIVLQGTTMVVKSTTAVTLANLAGTGSRAVLAASDGTLSAPVSDRSVKKNINDLDYGLNEIMRLRPVSFEYKNGWTNYGKGEQIGFIAQDIQQVLPNSVFTTPTTGKMGYNETDLIPVLVSAMQEQQKEIEGLRKEIKKLKHK